MIVGYGDQGDRTCAGEAEEAVKLLDGVGIIGIRQDVLGGIEVNGVFVAA
jgi:hypothetical protein